MIVRGLIAVGLLILTGCSESLPFREDDAQNVTSSVYSGYVSTGGRMSLVLSVSVKNGTDEVLDDVGRIDGTIRVAWVPIPQEDGNFNKSRTLTLSRSNILHGAAFFNTVTGRLRLPPGDSIVLGAEWDLKTDDGTYLMNLFRGTEEAGCAIVQLNGEPGKRRISEREHFTVSAQLRLFDRLSVFHPRTIETYQCVVAPYLSQTGKCRNVNLTDPCSLSEQ